MRTHTRQPSFSLRLDLAGFGISIVDRHARELAYISLLAVDISYTDADIDQCLQVTFGRFGAIRPAPREHVAR